MDRRIDQAQIRVYFFLNQNSIKQVAMGSFKSNCIVRREKVYLAMLLTNHLKENILNMQIVRIFSLQCWKRNRDFHFSKSLIMNRSNEVFKKESIFKSCKI